MKKALIIVLALAVLAVALTGASKWPAKVWIYNGDDASTAYFNFGGDEYPIVQLTVAPGEAKNFDFPRGVWDGKLTYCGMTKSFVIDAKHNVWLNLPSCAKARQTGRDLFLGEPSMEKYNAYRAGDTKVCEFYDNLVNPSKPNKVCWKFQY